MIKTLKENIMFKNKYWQVNENNVLFEENIEGKYFRLKPNSIGSVAIIPIDKEGYIHIQDEYRYGIEEYITHIVMGGINKGETPKEAAFKELEEEISLTTNKDLIDLGKIKEMVNIMDNEVHLFVAEEVEEKEDSIEKEYSESFTNKRKIKLEKAFEMAMNGEFKEPLTIIAIMKYYLLKTKNEL